MTEEYHITEKDIEGMLQYLKIFHPERANREDAKEILEYMKASYHRLAMTDPEALNKLLEEFEKSKKK